MERIKMGIDLHIHSCSSADGEFSAEELVRMAKKKGLEAIAIADHDTVNSVEEGLCWGKRYGVEVIPACEFSARYQGIILHILGYYLDIQNLELKEIFTRVEKDRQTVIDLQIQKLREAGFHLKKDNVMKDCNQTAPYPGTYANVIFADSRNREHPIIREYLQKDNCVVQFTFDYLFMGKSYYIPQYYPTAEDVIQLIRKGGGVSILAHPGSSLKDDKIVVLDDLRDKGLAGLEIYTSHHNEDQEQYYLDYCKTRGLLYTCGSDFHGKFKPKVIMGDIRNNTYGVVEELKSKRVL